jgi:uncharacterized protein YecE (DUF72 family)
MARAFIGPSGWNYPEWRAGFYAGVPQRRWLAHCAERFSGIEVNATFYRLLAKETFAHWRGATPAGFGFAIKGHRLVTHMHRLANCEDLLQAQRDLATALGDRLEVVLWQLPARFERDLPRLAGFVKALGAWPEPRHAFEFRDRSWFEDAVAQSLAEHGMAVVLSDSPKWPLRRRVTTDLVYVRLHGHTALYASRYSERLLAGWAAEIRGWLAEGRTVHAYFDNTGSGHAPANAARLIELVGAAAALPAATEERRPA